MATELDSVSLADVGLSPRAILFIPRMVVERPLRRGHSSGQFAHCVADGLKSALKRARRPWDSHSSDDPLLFEDETEVAAALIESWLRGSRERQWWPKVTGGLDPPAWWRRRVIIDSFVLPRVLARLAALKLANAWVSRLDPAEIERAIDTLAQGYGLPALPAGQALAAPADAQGARATAEMAVLVPEIAEAGIAPRSRLLVAMALAIHRSPAFASTAVALRAFAALADTDSVPLVAEALHRGMRPNARPRSRKALPPDILPPRMKPRKSGRDRPLPIDVPPSACLIAERQPSPSADTSAADVQKAQVPTEFGGLLFLLNALIRLEIYGDFTRPDRTLPGLSPFALLAHIGSHWFGSSFRRDPLHALLLDLAGEEKAWKLPRWSIPQTWLDPWTKPRSLRMGCERPRPYLWHPAGFPVAEARRKDWRPSRRPTTKGRRSPLPHSPVDRWIACLALYLRARLARTLERTDAVDLLCRQPATLQIDEDRLTARFALADHPLAIRIVGLDRDPGWIPAAGRIVEFEFE